MRRRANSMMAEAAFRARLAGLGAELLEPEWLGSQRPHRVRCAEGHACKPRPGDVRNGGGICRTCAGNDPAVAEAAFRARLAELGATLLEPEWLGVMRPHRVRCAEGHTGTPFPANVQRGGGICRTCAGLDPAVAEAAFRARLAGLGATLLEPEWLGSLRSHRVRCSAGHECTPQPHDVQKGGGICRTCAGLDPAVAEAAFRARLAGLGATLLEPEWLGVMRRHRVVCSAGHECRPRPNQVQQGAGICCICARGAQDAFYVVTADALHRLKFGITSGDGGPRLKAHRGAGYRTVVRLMTGLPDMMAAEMEQAVISALRLAGMEPVHGREWFDIAALALVLDIADNYQRTGVAV